jgi:hypothetical protein
VGGKKILSMFKLMSTTITSDKDKLGMTVESSAIVCDVLGLAGTVTMFVFLILIWIAVHKSTSLAGGSKWLIGLLIVLVSLIGSVAGSTAFWTGRWVAGIASLCSFAFMWMGVALCVQNGAGLQVNWGASDLGGLI